jgi:hypothetical protein
MRSIKLGLALVVALVFGVAMTASASATSFLSSAKEKLLSTNVADQVFVTEAGTTECTKAPITAGESSGTETTEQKATIKYESCTAFKIAEVTISPAEYAFQADGEVEILKLISIKVTGCEVSVPAQTVSKVDYATKGSNILLEPLVTGILYTASGSLCAKTGEFKNGTYKGHAEVMTASGSLSVMTGEAEENITTTEYTGAESGALTGTNRNPFELLAEVVRIIPNAGTGPILAGGTCAVGVHRGSLLTCTVVQDHPVGNVVRWRAL